ncbi:hypothetical protein GE21DRAFT_3207 [Neurospora crassa]|uniref:Uncharacterized protein n=2 Tax=Neurospora crassa TaxID=5141 RepID=Q1K543_NEUCR|nr:hypothetical protein NCU01805 [Neurospora crassa OR74A]EAA27247.1 hypothetical protein NCU01805 [Neurospora crassa OR74A]KHE79409.1 hypothetical protein GE21DRAFT_3207 [Neurospora crassa]CAD21172.1 hypothetical protein [Neurospora crassa]|eukprot:XP_956483.1 hypothetical protein NCU01805 [Neurospora crassa OR74A]
MAWDSKSTTGRRRGNSVASNASRGLRQGPRPPTQPKSAHVADPFLHDFLGPSFDAAAYLNAKLPPLQTSAGSSSSSSSSSSLASRSAVNQGTTTAAAAVPLSEVSLQAQSVLSQLNAHTTRLTNTLTQLTDDILRSGSRLAYEVELLRGETLSLAETLTEGLQEDVAKFVPGGISIPEAPAPAPAPATTPGGSTEGGVHQRRLSVAVASSQQQQQHQQPPQPETPAEVSAATAEEEEPQEPPHITQLRTLTLVRSRLDSVIQTFGSAIDFVFPPSEISAVSSFLSVSAPAPPDSFVSGSGGDPDSVASTEEKGQKVLQALRDEISSLLESNQDKNNDDNDPIKGIEEAAKRVGELKELVKVWKGTAEERGRLKFVEGLARMVEERHAALLKDLESGGGGAAARKGGDAAGGRTDAEAALRRVVGGEAEQALSPTSSQIQTESKGLSGYGLISQLNKFRNGL